jgi:hypothetical protein
MDEDAMNVLIFPIFWNMFFIISIDKQTSAFICYIFNTH